jgi:hypothetical protein
METLHHKILFIEFLIVVCISESEMSSIIGKISTFLATTEMCTTYTWGHVYTVYMFFLGSNFGTTFSL